MKRHPDSKVILSLTCWSFKVLLLHIHKQMEATIQLTCAYFFERQLDETLTFLRGKVVRSLNSSKGYPLEATKSNRTWSLQLPRKRLSRNSPLGVRIRSLLICSAESSSGSGGRACSNDKRIACKKKCEKIQYFVQYGTLIIVFTPHNHWRKVQISRVR